MCVCVCVCVCVCIDLSESLEVNDEHVGEGPEGDLLGGVLLLLVAVRTEPRVLAIQLHRQRERGRE